MRKLATLVLLLAACTGLKAGGEYDKWHFGFRAGIAWSPEASYGALGSQSPGTETVAEARMQLAPTFGIQGQYAVVPGVFSLGLLADYIRPIHKEAKGGKSIDPTIDGRGASQTMLRGELRFQFAARGNMNEGFCWFLSPTYTKAKTKHDDLYSLAEGKAGGGLGINTRSFGESSSTLWEAAIYYTPKFSSGTTVGGLTVEIRVGMLF